MSYAIFATTLLAALGTALLAGNFYSFSAFLMPALRGLSPARGIVTMQAVVLTTRKRSALTLFFGTAALCAFLAASTLVTWGSPGAGWRLVGSALFLLGAFPATMMHNVPLNTQLLTATPDTKDGHDQWHHFKRSWSLWNGVRMVATLLACACLILALVQTGSPFGPQ